MIQLWIIHTEQGQENPERFLSALTEEEKKKALSYRFEEDRIRSTLGAWLVHKAFEEDFPSEQYEINRNAYGKPYYPKRLLDEKQAYFNLSHAGELVVLAKAEFDLGVDTENVRPVDFNSFRTAFSEDEMKMIRQSDSPQDEFFSLWTKKEAFVKCIGKGLSALDEFDKSVKDYSFALYHCERHIITVCAKKTEKTEISCTLLK